MLKYEKERMSMQQENPISIAVLNPEDVKKNRMHVNYYLQSSTYAGEAPHEGFGIKAQLYHENRLIDESTIEDVTSSKDELMELIETLSRNTVTPVTLKDVIEDYIS
jgi:hypothetical protein